MKSSARLAAPAFLILLLAMAANAQMGHASPPRISGVWNPVVGSGAAYEVDTKGDKTEMEIVIVGKESVTGKDAYWYEMSFNSARSGGQMVTKTLMVIDGADTQVTRMIMQMPGRPPMEMSTQMMHQDRSRQPADIRSDAEDLGSESVTVPAGTFTCEHYRSKKDSADTWISEKVSPYGMVKHQSTDTTMVLTKVITNAKDKITGTPVPFSPQMMMQQQQGQPQQ
jgi:hypothetical protein